MTVFLVKTLNRSRVVHQRNDDLSVFCGICLFHDDPVTVEDTGIDHAFAFYLQHKGVSVRQDLCRNREVVLNMFLSEDWFSCGHGADDGYLDHLTAVQRKFVVQDLNGTRLGGIPADVAVGFQRFQMRVD